MSKPSIAQASFTARRSLRQWSLTALVLCAPTAPGWCAELDAILSSTAVEPPAEIGFHEERHSPMFKEPMILTGRLEYLAEGVLRKVIETPFAEDILIDGDEITVTRGGETRKLSLNRSRALKHILAAIEAVLRGDRNVLEESFQVDLAGTDAAWTLAMTPTSRAVAKRMDSLEIAGDSKAATSIRINLSGDEWHLMTIGQQPP